MKTRSRITMAVALLLSLFASFSAVAQVTADFTANTTQACSPLVVRFTDLSTGNPNSWKWDFGNGNTSNQKNPGAIYLQPGLYTIILIVSDGIDSDTITKQQYVQVFKDPLANFGAAVRTGCAPFEICFTDSSLGGNAGIASWLWDFGDGQSSTQQNPCITYNTAGNYAVSLYVVDSNGCSHQKTINNYIQIVDKPIASFTSNVTASCTPPLLVNFSCTTSYPGNLTYSWNFGNGNGTGRFTANNYPISGQYDVRLIVRNSLGCADTLFKPQYIAVEDLVAGFTTGTGQTCTGIPINFTDTSTSNPNSWKWTFGDGDTSSQQNPIHTYANAGTYTVTLITSNSPTCADTVTKNIQIYPSPTANFRAGDTINCAAPFNVAFTDLSTNAVSWLWNFGDTTTSTLKNPSHTYTSLGQFSVSLTINSANGCSNTIVKPNLVDIIAPEARFIGDTVRGCIPLTVDFIDSSKSQEPIVNWIWNFGDGTTSTLRNPSHTYSANGKYTVTLVIINADGCIDTLVRTDYVQAGTKPNANYVANPLQSCLFSPVSFSNLSPNTDQWFWDFGDGGTSQLENPSYSYADTGYMDVRLIVMNNGCADTLIKTNYIHISPPDALYNVVRDCNNPYTISFVDQSLAPNTWYWSFGDSTNSSTPSPVHTFPGRGTYLVTLTVTDTVSGCLDIEGKPILITDPVAKFKADTTIGCHPFTTTFRDSSIDAASYVWETAGMTSTAKNPTFTYNTPGIYDVKLIITDANGCKDTLIKPQYITVRGPIANFGVDRYTGCAPLTVAFSDSSRGNYGNVIAWKWNFGNGDSAAVQNPTYIYNTTGYYNVTLSVTDDNGCSNSLTRSNLISPTFPKPSFTSPTMTCEGGSITFTNTSIAVSGTYKWFFGDGDSSSLQNPSHVYRNEGSYTVTLVATDANGCDSTLVIPNYINVVNPIANFTADSIFSPCPPLLANFRDLSTGAAAAWQWDFGDGTGSALQNPSKVYSVPGTYDVKLIVTSLYGCVDTIIYNDFITVQGPNGTFTFNPLHDCTGNEITFFAVTTNTVDRTWDFGDGTVLQGPDTTRHIYANYGVYHPVMILDDGLGCLYSVSSTDSVVIGKMDVQFNVDTRYLCKFGTVRFTDSTYAYPPATSWFWDFGDGSTSTDQHPLHYYASPGMYTVKLSVTNPTCTDSLIKTNYIIVDDGPQAGFTYNGGPYCVPFNAQFTDTTTSDSIVAQLFWDFGNGMYDSIANPAQLYDSAGVYNVSLIVTTVSGCSDTAYATINVHSLPVAVVTPDTFLCRTDTIMLSATGGSQYAWTPAAGLNDTAIATPLASPANTTTYYIMVTDTNGCTDDDSVYVRVHDLPVAKVANDTAICRNNSIELWAMGGYSYEWTPATHISCDTCAITVAIPDSTTAYEVKVSTQLGCYVMDTVNVTVYQLPEGIAETEITICQLDTVQLHALGGIAHTWYGPTGLSCYNCPDPLAYPMVTSSYVLDISNANCGILDSLKINVNPVPVLDIQAPEYVCAGEEVIITASGADHYAWTSSSNYSCNDCSTINHVPAEPTTYYLDATTNFGCHTYDTVFVNVKPLPTVATIDDLTLCVGDNIQLNTTILGAVSQSWTPALGLSDTTVASPYAAPTTTTNYIVTATSEFGCTIKDSVLISSLAKVVTDAMQDTSICIGQSVQLQASIVQQGHTGTQIIWSPLNGMTDAGTLTPTVMPLATQTYTLIAYSGSCLPDTQSITVTVNELPTVAFDKIGYQVTNTFITLQPQVGDNVTAYQWQPAEGLSCSDCPNPSVTVKNTSAYLLTVMDDKGCTNSAEVLIPVSGPCGEDVFVPNFFSPNGDEKNEVLYVRGLGLNGLKSFRIFDRWGNMVFQTTDINEGWNGTYNGSMLDPGVFVYFVETICTNGQTYMKQGNVTLMR
ncbi:MAG: PKD domain-containing protein [Chitinophagales bacterium]|nr:PKD domain-containing protein [Chitinophagales bacterium]